MPRIISYTPSWLSRPSPGFDFFAETRAQRLRRPEEQYSKEDSTNHDSNIGPSRTIAHRGAEVFVVVGNQIRWADLSLLKEGHEQSSETPSKGPRTANGHTEDVGDDGPEDGSYRVLKTAAIHGSIRQISISRSGKLLAIATSHTVHLAILPDPSHLGQLPNKALKLKTSTVGRSIHVVSQSPISNILWHPCGVSGSCLVTITTDATVRLWEFNEGNRYALDTPSLAIDLRKLALGTSDQEDFAPDRGKNRAFSSDSVGMEVASACFGGAGSSSESPWSALTLWVAMKAGDIYALCPLCPAEWQASDTMLPSLSTSVVARAAVLEGDDVSETEASRQNRDQYAWIQEVDGQEPLYKDNGNGSEVMSQIYRRPKHLSAVPKLQGPFQMTAEEDDGPGGGEDLEFSDICVVASRIDRESIETGDESDSEPDADENELSATLVCLMTKSGRLYICLDLEGVEGQWLPRKQPTLHNPSSPDPYLIVLEGLDTLRSDEAHEDQWPIFSPDVDSRYSFFTTHSRGVYFFSLDPWLPNLEKELQSADSTGVSFRLDVFKNGPTTLRENILSFKQDSSQSTGCSVLAVPACVVLEDSDLGYFLLTTRDNHPQAATLDRPFPQAFAHPNHLNSIDEDENIDTTLLPSTDSLNVGPARSAYQPADAFYVPSDLTSFVGHKVPARHKNLLSQPIRLSPATLDLMTESHRVLSRETHLLGVAAADLFRRCERLMDELKDQIGRVQECAVRTEDVLGADDTEEYDDADKEGEKAEEKEGDGQGESTKPSRLEERLHRARDKQTALQERHEALKRKVHGVGGRNLSEKEKAWKLEVERTGDVIKKGRADNGEMRKSTDERGDSEMETGEDENEEDEGEYDDNDSNDSNVNGDANGKDANAAESETGTLQRRLQEVQRLRSDLLAQARDILAATDTTLPQNRPRDESQLEIPQDIKTRKMAQVMALLDRESTLVEAASKRLEKLNLGVISS